MEFDIRYVQGHVEVYDGDGRFRFSADTAREAGEGLGGPGGPPGPAGGGKR